MGKNVAVFFDGTRNRWRIDGGTNVFALYEMARAAGGTQQCLYLSGVGTERIKTGLIDSLRERAMLGKEYHRIDTGPLGRLFGAVAGYGIGGRIKEAYAFIVDHYDEAAGDKLFLFGFSRGAFAARSLAGFIGEVGLLFRCHLSKVPEAYELYRSARGREFLEKNYSKMLGQKVTLGEGLQVYMIGVWDTVGALGFPPPFQKIAYQTDHHLTHEMPANVSHGRHALALHELRSIFAPVPWKRAKGNTSQSLQQVWFAGAHADVGGGYEGSTLSTIPLSWMALEAESLGLSLNHHVLRIEDTTTDIHHEIKGPFALLTPQCRKLLKNLSESSSTDELETYSIHWSVIRRQDRLAILNKPYPHRRAISTTLADIDRTTRAVAIRLTEYAEHLNAVDNSDLYGDQKALLEDVLMRDDAWTTERLGELKDAIVLVILAHGWMELAPCLISTINRLATKTGTVDASSTAPQTKRQLDAALQALKCVSKELLGEREKKEVRVGELQSLVDKIALFATLAHNLDEKKVKIKVVKI